MFEKKLVSGMKGFNRFMHALLALALGIASVMVIWDVSVKIYGAWQAGNAAQGFLHALGSLFVLWTLSTLISAEIDYIQTGRIYARVFVIVAMISTVRELIVAPVQAVTGGQLAGNEFNPVSYGLLLAALLVIGIVYRLVGEAKDDGGITMDA